jgi:hypothetical protein
MKTAPAAWLIAAFTIAVPLSLRSQSALEHAPSLPSQMGSSGNVQELAASSQGSAGASASATPNQEANTAEHDDSLYRGKTSDSENTMLRDEGALHFKTHPKERVKEVDRKSLPTSGTDPKFQGSFISAGTSSIDSVASKGYEPPEARVAKENEPQGDARYKRHMTFAAPEEEKPSKSDADSSPSPSPSPSASPAKKKSTDAKQ